MQRDESEIKGSFGHRTLQARCCFPHACILEAGVLHNYLATTSTWAYYYTTH